MLWLAVHIWFLLFAAFGVGLGIGWWIWGARESTRQNQSPKRQTKEAGMGTLNSDFVPPVPDSNLNNAHRRPE